MRTSDKRKKKFIRKKAEKANQVFHILLNKDRI